MDRKFEKQHLMRKNEEVYNQSVRGREKRLYEASVDGSVNSLK